MQREEIIPVNINFVSEEPTPIPISVQVSIAEVDEEEIPTKKKKRCAKCSKRVGLYGFTCKCGELYCENHMQPESHQCTFDFKKHQRAILEKNNPKIVRKQIEL